MTYENVSMESLHGVDYSRASTAESRDTPVLDLSCKKSPPSSPTSNYEKDTSVSPLRGSIYLEHHQDEANNNDRKQMHNYQAEPEKMQTTHYETTSFSSSNHERTSPFENRAYIMTPPSEAGSPKRQKFQPIYEHTNISMNYPSYPILPMNIPVPVPISVPQVIPQLLSQNSITPVHQNQMPTSSTTHESSQTSVSSDDTKKAPRPFKAYPKDPLSITMGPDMIFDQELKQAYSDFRNRMLDSVKRTNEGTNIKMRRMSKSPMLPTSTCDDKDAAYWERRRKNNEAAKRSRDARRAKEDEIAIRAAFLEQEYLRLKYENTLLKEENKKLSSIVYRAKV